MTEPHILVLTATGNVGRQLVRQLRAEGHRVKAATRDPRTATFPADVQVVRADLSDPNTLRDRVADFDAVFLLWPLHSGEQFAEAVGVISERARRLVFLGTGGVPDLSREQQQEVVHGSGIESVVLQPSGFAVNTLWWADQIRAGDIVRGIHGELPLMPLHEADMAAVARHALLEPGHSGKTYTLTGPQVLTLSDQVRVIGEVLGRPLRWVENTRAEEAELLRANPNFPDSYIEVLLDGYAALLDEPRPTTTDTIERIIGRPARTLRDWVGDHIAEFR
ncbi:SDR family oxidoreductase [Nocardia panacis]|uniref:SDR family oxidoreductase n=1 Tax=Nocardia panacis TaxID=2340916 RepID=UPI00193A2B81|nr:NAD(P)H-binding protein [Nocardia panacis]